MRKWRNTIQTLSLAIGMGVLAMAATPAWALDVTATITADNHYVLYTGDATGSNLTRIGRNEFGSGGSPGTYNWSLPETYTFTMDACQYLYLAVWDDQSTDQMWIGEFNINGVGTLLSNTTDWVYYKSSIVNPGDNGDVTDASVPGEIAVASWAAPAISAPQGTSPWNTIAGISNSAEFVWHNHFGKPNADDGYVILYRTENCVVPVPPSMLLLGSGLIGLVGWGSRRKKK